MDKQDDKQERVIPKLRFPEFQATLGWDKDILGNLFAERSKKNNPEKTVLAATQDKGVIPYELMDKSVIRDRKNLGGYKLVLPEDFVISLRSFEGGFEYSKYEGIISPAYVVLYPKVKICNYFFRIYFKQDSFIQQIQNSLNNSLRDGKSISYKQASTLFIALPKIEEQQKIADCLSSIDELIELQEQKLAALKQHKKGLMQQLFPSHNDLQASKQAIVYPKLRFPQFKDCKGWEIVELEELFDLTIQNEKANSFDKDKIITVKLHTLGVVKNERTDTLTGGANYFHRKAGDFIFSKIDFLNGAFGIVPNELDGFCSSSDIPSFPFKPESNANFFMYWLKANYLDFKIERAGTSNTLKRISPKALFAMQLPMPLPEEQQAIADCLSSLDKLISEENEQISHLKDHKKGLMQQLFPKIQ